MTAAVPPSSPHVDPYPGKRMLLIHAHPDDETLATGGTIAHYARRGVDVTVLTCTLGEEGEIIGEQWAGLAASAADQLGGYRVLELTRALAALGARAPRFLGGAGRWRDSGMADAPASARRANAFVNADPAEAVAAMVDVLDELRPDVVVTYDPHGGYGHPDHIQAHRLATAAIESVETARGWAVPKHYWTVTDIDAAKTALSQLSSYPQDWRLPRESEFTGVRADQVTTVVDVSDALDAKLAALRAHATQIAVAPDGRSYALSNNIVAPVLGVEHYILVQGTPGPVGPDGREHDLFGGLA